MAPTLKDQHISAWEALPVDIAANNALSGTISVGGLRLFAIAMPTDWTAASLSFQVSLDAGATWRNLKDQKGNEITVTAEAGTCHVLDATQFAAFQYVRVRAGTAAAPVNQASARTLTLVLRSI